MLLPGRNRCHARAGFCHNSDSHRNACFHSDTAASDPDLEPGCHYRDSFQHPHDHAFSNRDFNTDSDRVHDGNVDGYPHSNRFIYFHAFVYTIRHFYVNGNLYPNIQLYPGYTFGYTHAIHYSLPQPII